MLLATQAAWVLQEAIHRAPSQALPDEPHRCPSISVKVLPSLRATQRPLGVCCAG